MKNRSIMVYTSNIITKNTENDNLLITGIASTTNKDLQNEIVSKEAILSMQKQVVGLNLHLDHDHSFDGAIGVITESDITPDNELIITANIFPKYATEIREKLEFGMSMGLSIGGIPTRNRHDPNLIDDIKLLEVSLTPLPANNDSQGSVEIVKGVIVSNCFGKACAEFLKKENKNMNENDIKKETDENKESSEEIVETKQFSKEECIQLINEAIAKQKEAVIEEVTQKFETQLKNIEETINNDTDSEEDEEIVEEEVESELNKEEEIVEVDSETKPEEEEKEEEKVESEKSYPDLNKKSESKIDKALNSATAKTKTFLNSENRDIFGRNKKYL